MKKLLALAIIAATSPSAFASNQITDVITNRFNASYIEAHFLIPDNSAGRCNVQVREMSYPNTVLFEEESRNEPGSPSDLRQWADFEVPFPYRNQEKQVRITCPTASGDVVHTRNLPAPPKITFDLKGVSNADGSVDISGGMFVEGRASGTYCRSISTSAVVGHELFTQTLLDTAGFYSSYINVAEHVPYGLIYNTGLARFECHGEGGTTVELLEFSANLNDELVFTQQTTNWY